MILVAMTSDPTRPCPDCGVDVSNEHLVGICDIARCLATGGQRLSCEMSGAAATHDCGRDIWTGQFPGVAECIEFGWYAQDRRAEGLGWVPCAPDAPGARPDLNRLAYDARWDAEQQRWVRREVST